MATRPIFIPKSTFPFVAEEQLEFEWYPGFAKTQAQKSIASLHNAAKIKGINPVLEISSKSRDKLGIELSAFNLKLTHKGKYLSVECAFQGSKVFEQGGPYTDLYGASSRDAKTDERLKNSGKLIKFIFFDESFPTIPMTVFYDWLYIVALWQNPQLAQQILAYRGFTDIVFNPKRSINCQARSAALFIALNEKNEIENIANDKEYYINLMTKRAKGSSQNRIDGKQLSLPL